VNSHTAFATEGVHESVLLNRLLQMWELNLMKHGVAVAGPTPTAGSASQEMGTSSKQLPDPKNSFMTKIESQASINNTQGLVQRISGAGSVQKIEPGFMSDIFAKFSVGFAKRIKSDIKREVATFAESEEP
jgi:hypothetical protein